MRTKKIIEVKQEVVCPYCGYLCCRGKVPCDHLITIADSGHVMKWEFWKESEDPLKY